MKLWLILPLVLSVACGAYEPSSAAPSESSRRDSVGKTNTRAAEEKDQGGMDVLDAAVTRAPNNRSSDAGARQASNTRSAPAAGSGGMSKPSERPRDAGANEATDNRAKPREEDAGQNTGSEPPVTPETPETPETPDMPSTEQMIDAGSDTTETTADTRSCCSTSSEPGCGDPALQACVCEIEPRCCSEAWNESCTRVIAEKNCQSGVRECVCGNGEGQWQQAHCCEGGWNNTCESVAINKCGATAECQ